MLFLCQSGMEAKDGGGGRVVVAEVEGHDVDL